MSSESIKSPETLEVVTKAVIRELGLLNINASFEDDEVFPALIELQGSLDSTVYGQGNDDDIKYVVDKMNRTYRGYEFAYDGQGLVTVMPKETPVDSE